MADREAKGISLKKRIIGKDKGGTKKKTVVKKKKVTIAGKKNQVVGENGEIREGEDIEDDEEEGENHNEDEDNNSKTKTFVGGSATVRKTKALKALKELE